MEPTPLRAALEPLLGSIFVLESGQAAPDRRGGWAWWASWDLFVPSLPLLAGDFPKKHGGTFPWFPTGIRDLDLTP